VSKGKEFSKEWCMEMAKLEEGLNIDITAGVPDSEDDRRIDDALMFAFRFAVWMVRIISNGLSIKWCAC
jgi:hypothetical protein